MYCPLAISPIPLGKEKKSILELVDAYRDLYAMRIDHTQVRDPCRDRQTEPVFNIDDQLGIFDKYISFHLLVKISRRWFCEKSRMSNLPRYPLM